MPQQAAIDGCKLRFATDNASVKINTGIPVRMPVGVYSIHERLLITAQQQKAYLHLERYCHARYSVLDESHLKNNRHQNQLLSFSAKHE
jgi:hypothetical protein